MAPVSQELGPPVNPVQFNPPPEDPYAIELDSYRRPDARKLGKLMFNIALNAKNERSALSALYWSSLQNLGIRLPKGHARRVLDAVKAKNAPISGLFSTGLGLKLQRLDSDIMLDIVECVTSDDEPCIPVHDSIIVPHDPYAGVDGEPGSCIGDFYMRAFFRAHAGADITVTRTVGVRDTRPMRRDEMRRPSARSRNSPSTGPDRVRAEPRRWTGRAEDNDSSAG